jgi:F1F0 ATPase subunit 2
MVIETLPLLLALPAGVLLGVFFFGGLWWTIRKGLSSKHPALWFLGSLLLRTSMTVTGFYFVASGHWERLLACLLGFVIARFLVAWLTQSPGDDPTRSPGDDPTHSSEEARHAT